MKRDLQNARAVMLARYLTYLEPHQRMTAQIARVDNTKI
jgi:hypothetical protein